MIKTDNDWKDFLDSEQQKDYYKELKQFLVKEYETGNVYPPADSIFKAFEILSLIHISEPTRRS